MSAKSTDSGSGAPPSSTLIPQSELFRGSSTPLREYEEFVPLSDISSITSHASDSNSVASSARPGRSTSQSRVVLEGSISRTPRRKVSPRRSTSNPTPKKPNLEDIVSERLALPSTSVTKSLSNTFNELHIGNQELEDSNSLNGPPAKKYKVALKGKEWEAFKPKHQDRMYAHVLTQPNNTLKEAKKWVLLFEEDAPRATIALLQFFVDVCGYQDFNVCSIFKYEEENYKELRDFMQENAPQYQKDTAKYLMKGTSNWSEKSQNAIYAFIKDLLENCYENEVHFDKLMFLNLNRIAMSLVYSCNRSMHHTGVVLMAKMYTSFLRIHSNIQRKVDRYRKESRVNTEQLNELIKVNSLLLEVLKKLQNILEEHCYVEDPALAKMEVTVLKEMFQWFEINPVLLSSSKYFRKLMKLVTDQSKIVRSAAIEVCHKLINDSKMVGYVTPLIEKFVEVVVGRVYDKDYGIAAEAVYICTDILNSHPNALSDLYRDRIMMFVYGENYQLAIASGSFVTEILNKYCKEADKSRKFIKLLIKFSTLETEKYVPLLVETILPHSFQLHDWNTMITLLLEGNLVYKDKIILIDIMSHAALQSITGKSKVTRGKPIQGHPKIQNIRKIWGIFLKNLYSLMKEFSKEPKSITMFCEVLLVIDYKDASIIKYTGEVINIIKVLDLIFIQSNEKEVLEIISMVLAKLCEDFSVFKNRATKLVKVSHKSIVESIVNQIEHLNQIETPPEEIIRNIETLLLKFSALFIHHDLTELIDQDLINWLNFEGVITTKSMDSIVTCGYWYLTWMLRKIIGDLSNKTQSLENLQQLINQLKTSYNEYVKYCYNFIKRSGTFVEWIEMFGCMCKIHVTFTIELKNPSKINPVLKDLTPGELEMNQRTVLISFAERLLFEEMTVPLKLRRVCLGNVMNLAILRIIPYEDVIKIFTYYHSHFDDYGSILVDGLRRFRDIGIVLVVGIVLRALIHCFTNNDLETIEARHHLQKLAKQYQIFFAKSADEIKLILQLGIKYTVYSESRYTFLEYLKCFVDALSGNDKKIILNEFLSKIENTRDHPALTEFIGYLKSKPKLGRPAQQRRESTTTSNISEEEYSIEEDTEEEEAGVETDSADENTDFI